MKKWIFLLVFLLISGNSFASYDYYYYLGPFQETEINGETMRVPPESTIGLVDLTPPNSLENIGFFATTEELGEDYFILLHGDIVKDNSTEGMKDLWEENTGYRPNGDFLVELLWDYLTVGSDPSGVNNVMPLMPTHELLLELHLGGHSLIKSEKFNINLSPHKDKVIEVLKNNYRKSKEESEKNKDNKYLKILDFMGEKYGVSNPEDYFIPDDLPKEKPLKHETTITESFNTANSDTLGPDLSWTETEGDVDILNNQASVPANAVGSARTGSVSSDDNYVQADVYLDRGSDTQSLIIVTTRRESSGNVNYYGVRITDNSAGDSIQLEKRVVTTTTTLEGPTSITVSSPETIKVSADGSTIKGYRGVDEVFSQTDTAITTSVLSGFRGYMNLSGTLCAIDNFEAGDLTATGAPPQIF